MQMTTSSYLTAFQGARAVWNYLRKKDVEPEASEHEMAMESTRLEHERRMEAVRQDRELALAKVATVREVAAVGAEAQAIAAEAEARARTARLAPIMAAFETVQANKRAKAEAAQPATSSE
jgi:primosomal protein N''